jgi:hypothetical protein
MCKGPARYGPILSVKIRRASEGSTQIPLLTLRANLRVLPFTEIMGRCPAMHHLFAEATELTHDIPLGLRIINFNELKLTDGVSRLIIPVGNLA